jgi:ParB-like nuclease domain
VSAKCTGSEGVEIQALKILGLLGVLSLRAAIEEASGAGGGDYPQPVEAKAYTVELVSPDSIRPYEGNPRKNGKAVDKVAASIEAYGFRQPIVVDGEGVIVVGHTRWLAAERLGLGPVHRAGSLPGEEEARACRPMDNRAHEGSTWDQGCRPWSWPDRATTGSTST